MRNFLFVHVLFFFSFFFLSISLSLSRVFDAKFFFLIRLPKVNCRTLCQYISLNVSSSLSLFQERSTCYLSIFSIFTNITSKNKSTATVNVFNNSKQLYTSKVRDPFESLSLFLSHSFSLFLLVCRSLSVSCRVFVYDFVSIWNWQKRNVFIDEYRENLQWFTTSALWTHVSYIFCKLNFDTIVWLVQWVGC